MMAQTTAREVIDEIRRNNGADPEMLQHPVFGPPTFQLKKNLTRALHALSEELYSKPSHFLMEFVQNADDNKYPSDVTPTLELDITNSSITISSNEVGFTAEEVRAICRVGASTKKGNAGYIGEKGIGFKSVFKVAQEVYVNSGPFTFKFDAEGDLGMITPRWDTTYHTRVGWTTFHLQLLPEHQNSAVLVSYADSLHATLLLFLRKLQSITITLRLTGRPISRSCFSKENIDTKENIDRQYLKLTRNVNGSISRKIYLMVHEKVRMPAESKRQSIRESVLILAFPLAMDRRPDIEVQNVYAFLPLRSYGFPFLLQADFLTSANREDILSDLGWNTTLRDAIPRAFMQAVPSLRDEPSWLQFIPHPQSLTGFFSGIERKIIDSLKSREILYNANGTLVQPERCIILLDSYLDDDGKPLVEARFLPKNSCYVGRNYIPDHLQVFDLRVMDSEILLQCLQRMGTFARREAVWIEQVADLLVHRRGWLYVSESQLNNIALLKLADGSWVPPSTRAKLYFWKYNNSVPDGLDMTFVSPKVQPGSALYRLYAALGVSEMNSCEVTTEILRVHASASTRGLSTNVLLVHCEYLYKHDVNCRSRHEYVSTVAPDEDGQPTKVDNLYVDTRSLPRGRGPSVSLKDVFPADTKFIDPAFASKLDSRALEWLIATAGLNINPKLLAGTYLSPELEHALKHASGSDVLELLSQCWTELQAALPSIKTTVDRKLFPCLDNHPRSLSETCLRRKKIIHAAKSLAFPLPCLAIGDPDNGRWNFLSNFGVTTDASLGLYLLWLKIIAKSPPPHTESELAHLYRLIDENSTVQDSSRLRDTFSKEVILIPSTPNTKIALTMTSEPQSSRWCSTFDLVWAGPSTMMSKIALSRVYPDRHRLFRELIMIPNAEPSVLMDELSAFIDMWTNRVLTQDAQNELMSRLRDIMRTHGLSEEHKFLKNLPDKPLVPVVAQDAVVLSNETCYLSDEAGSLKQLFADKLPFVSLIFDEEYRHFPVGFKSAKPFTGVKRIETEVTTSTEVKGERQRENRLEQDLLARVPYINALLDQKIDRLPRNEPSLKRLRQLLKSLPSMEVYSVDTILTTYTVGDHSVSRRREVFIEAQPFQVFVVNHEGGVRLCGDDGNDVACWACISDQLAKLLFLNLSDMTLVLELPERAVRSFLSRKGLKADKAFKRGTDDCDYDDSWLEKLPSIDVEGISAVPTLPNLDQLSGKDSANFRLTVRPSIAEQQAGIIGQFTRSKRASIVSHWTADSQTDAQSRFISSQRPYQDLPVDDEAQATPQISSTSLLMSVSSASKSSDTSERTLMNGILGEITVFKWLADLELPGFGDDNWTSQFRERMPHMPPFSGEAVAKFEYDDVIGKLTRQLWKHHFENWSGKWPRYYIDVKSTSKDEEEPFHLTPAQFELAAHLRLTESSTPPKAVYVLARVSDVRGDPQLSTYPDPISFFATGVLEMEGDLRMRVNAMKRK